jgi:hypothetical protein
MTLAAALLKLSALPRGWTHLRRRIQSYLGVSKGAVAKHDEFQAKYDLGIPLPSDADSEVCENYGVWHQREYSGNPTDNQMPRAFSAQAAMTFVASLSSTCCDGMIRCEIDLPHSDCIFTVSTGNRTVSGNLPMAFLDCSRLAA